MIPAYINDSIRQNCIPVWFSGKESAGVEPRDSCDRGFKVAGGTTIHHPELAGVQEAVFQAVLPEALADLREGKTTLQHFR